MSSYIQALIFVYPHFEEFSLRYQIPCVFAVKLWFIFGIQKSKYQGLQKIPVQFYLSILQKCFMRISVKDTNSWPFVSPAESDSGNRGRVHFHFKSIPWVFFNAC